MNSFKTLESCLAAPLPKIRAAEIEGLTELDEHVQGHEQAENILAPLIVDKIFDGHESAAGWQRTVSGADEAHFLFEIPVVEDHSHRDDVGFGQRIFEEIATSGADAITEPGRCNVSLRDRLYRRQVERNARKMRMLPRNFNTE